MPLATPERRVVLTRFAEIAKTLGPRTAGMRRTQPRHSAGAPWIVLWHQSGRGIKAGAVFTNRFLIWKGENIRIVLQKYLGKITESGVRAVAGRLDRLT